MGYPPVSRMGYPPSHQQDGVPPHPNLGWGSPQLAGWGTTQSAGWGTPIQTWDGLTPLSRPGMGYPPPPYKCGQTETVTFPHPSDTGSKMETDPLDQTVEIRSLI